jgi:hypothetical protein
VVGLPPDLPVSNLESEMKKQIAKKLELHKETVGILTANQLDKVAGGRIAPSDGSCVNTWCCAPPS